VAAACRAGNEDAEGFARTGMIVVEGFVRDWPKSQIMETPVPGTNDHIFAQPTLEDFRACLAWHLTKAAESASRRTAALTNELAAKGLARSGNRIILTFDVAHEEFLSGIDAALGELKRALVRTALDRECLRITTENKLREFVVAIKHVTRADEMRKWAGNAAREIDKRLLAFDQELGFALRQFDVGFRSPPEPEVPQVSNNLVVGHMSGGAIQQATANSSQQLPAPFCAQVPFPGVCPGDHSPFNSSWTSASKIRQSLKARRGGTCSKVSGPTVWQIQHSSMGRGTDGPPEILFGHCQRR